MLLREDGRRVPSFVGMTRLLHGAVAAASTTSLAVLPAVMAIRYAVGGFIAEHFSRHAIGGARP